MISSFSNKLHLTFFWRKVGLHIERENVVYCNPCYSDLSNPFKKYFSQFSSSEFEILRAVKTLFLKALMKECLGWLSIDVKKVNLQQHFINYLRKLLYKLEIIWFHYEKISDNFILTIGLGVYTLKQIHIPQMLQRILVLN